MKAWKNKLNIIHVVLEKGSTPDEYDYAYKNCNELIQYLEEVKRKLDTKKLKRSIINKCIDELNVAKTMHEIHNK